jgi:hypothetical protein
MKTIKIYTVKEVLSELNDCIIRAKPFSLIRFGDGGLKFLHSILINNQNRILSVIKKEGIPVDKIYSVFYLWGKYVREANFIDTPKIYFTNKFWRRFKRSDIIPIIKDWKNIYDCSEFDNDRYCNPEINFLSILKGLNKNNLIDIIRNKKVYCITNYPEVKSVLNKICNYKIIQVVGFHENQYKHNYKNITRFIKENANNCDIWLVGAGELGRIYSGLIKQYGGRALDMGSVFDFWAGAKLPKRLINYIYRPSKNSIEVRLTKDGMKYKNYL